MPEERSRMLGPSLLGRTVVWRGSPDPPGSWAFVLEDEVVAELEWSDGGIRVELPGEVGRMQVWGTLMIRAILVTGEKDVPRLWYAGNLVRGLARCREGRGFTFVRGLDRQVGPWTGFDDAEGAGVLRARGRVGGGAAWSEIAVTPDPVFSGAVGPLLVLWGALRIVHLRRPWLRFTAEISSERAVQEEIERMCGRR
jgi:hypothetical protein